MRTRSYLIWPLTLFVAAGAPPTAVAAKPGGGSAGQSASQVGDKAADLISGNLTQLLIVLIGCAAIAAFFARSIGQAMMIVVGGLFAGLFIIEPDGAVNLFKGIYNSIL